VIVRETSVTRIVELKWLMIEHKPFRLQVAPNFLYKFKYINFWQFVANFSVFKFGLILEIEKSCVNLQVGYICKIWQNLVHIGLATSQLVA